MGQGAGPTRPMRRARRSTRSRPAGYGTAIKPMRASKPRIAGGFTRDDFTIDTDAQTVTAAPPGTPKPSNRGAARFGALCGGCPLPRRVAPPPPPGARVTGRRTPSNAVQAQQDPTGHSPQPRSAYRVQHQPHGRTLHRVAHPQQGQTRPLPRRRRQPPLAHHQSCRRQPRANLTNLGITPHSAPHARPCEPPRQRRAPRHAPPTAPHKPRPRDQHRRHR